MATQEYHIRGKQTDEAHVLFDYETCSEFTTKILPRLESYTIYGIYWNAPSYNVPYDRFLNFSQCIYRPQNGGKLVRSMEKKQVWFSGSYDIVETTPIVDGMNPLQLITQYPSDPYVEYTIFPTQLNSTEKTGSSALFGTQYNVVATSIVVKMEYKGTSVNNLNIERDNTNKRYILTPTISYYDKFIVEVIQVNYDGNGNDKISKTITVNSPNLQTYINYSDLQQGLNRLKVTAYNGDKTALGTKDFYHYIPTISNLTLTNDNKMIDYPTIISWDSTNQYGYKVYNNDSLILQQNNTTIKSVEIQKGVLIEGKNTIRVEIIGIGDSSVLNSNVSVSASKEITLGRIKPSIADLTISGTNIDEDIELTWSANNITGFSIEPINYTSDSSGNSYIIPKGTLSVNNTYIKVIVKYDSGFGILTAEEQIDVTFTQNEPIINNLEPSGINKNINEQIIVTFQTNLYVDRWELITNGNNINSGTNSRQVLFPPNTFKKGENVMALKVYYSPIYNSNIVRTSIKTVKFNGYGKPDNPIFENNTTFSTSTPTIFWSSSEQTGFKIRVYKNNASGELVHENLTAIGTLTQYTLPTLEDKTNYLIQLSIKNEYDLYSDWAETTISTLFSNINVPDFYLTENNNTIQLYIAGEKDDDFKSISIFRKYKGKEWVEIGHNFDVLDVMNDTLFKPNTLLMYKIRVYNTSGAYKDSEYKTIKVKFNKTYFTNMIDFNKCYGVIGATIKTSFVNNIVSKIYSNQSRPVTFVGKSNYRTLEITIEYFNNDYDCTELLNELLEQNISKTYCIRNMEGEKIYCTLNINSHQRNGVKNIVSISGIEINFNETKMYKGSIVG